ncbi:MAG: MoaD/ThiS family protein [Bacteroidota bacterium]|nr:MoaD/ThiS family protein [Bacteroidota bacterium]
MKIKLLLFGILSTLVKKQELEYKDVFSIKELKHKLFQQYPELKPYQFQVYVNQQAVKGTHVLKAGDEIALIPPFAGG